MKKVLEYRKTITFLCLIILLLVSFIAYYFKAREVVYDREDNLFIISGVGTEHNRGIVPISFGNITISCYSDTDICLNYVAENKIKVFDREGNKKREYKFNLEDENKWVDNAISINQDNTEFVLRVIYEYELDYYKASYLYLNEEGTKPLTISNTKEIHAGFKSLLDYRYDRVINNDGPLRGAFRLNKDVLSLEYDKFFDLEKLPYGKYIVTKDVTSERDKYSLIKIDGMMSSDLKHTLILEQDKSNGVIYVQEYDLEPYDGRDLNN